MRRFIFSAICAVAMLYSTSSQAEVTPTYAVFLLSCGSVSVVFDWDASGAEMLYLKL